MSNSSQEESKRQPTVYMCGYLPGASSDRTPLLSPVPVKFPATDSDGDCWKEVSGGGCGFAMAISGSGELITWGSTDDEGQSYLTSGKHGEIPEPVPLPSESSVIKAAAGWAHCVAVTENGEVFTWGWRECVPAVKLPNDAHTGGGAQKDTAGKQGSLQEEQVSPRSQKSNATPGTLSHSEKRKDGEDIAKRRRVSATKDECEGSPSGEELFTTLPTLVSFGPGVKITNVSAGGRHTLGLSDMGQVWGWGYGGEGQLGLGSRIKMVSSPHLIPCIESLASDKDKSAAMQEANPVSVNEYCGTFVKEIACGGRHSAVLTDTGSLITFGWGLYGQCGQGSTSDQLKPTHIPSPSGIQIEKVAAGLWHTVCIAKGGRVFAFGGNQFGQLGTGADRAENIPKLLDAPSLESKKATMVSCGARHSFILTEDELVFSWGWNKYGQLGLGDSMDRNIPSQVQIDGQRPKSVACGWWHTLLLVHTS